MNSVLGVLSLVYVQFRYHDLANAAHTVDAKNFILVFSNTWYAKGGEIFGSVRSRFKT